MLTDSTNMKNFSNIAHCLLKIGQRKWLRNRDQTFKLKLIKITVPFNIFGKNGIKTGSKYRKWWFKKLCFLWVLRWISEKCWTRNYHMIQQFYSKVYTLENWKHRSTKELVHTCSFIVALLITAKRWKKHQCPSTN